MGAGCRNTLINLLLPFADLLIVAYAGKGVVADQKMKMTEQNWLCLDKMSTHF